MKKQLKALTVSTVLATSLVFTTNAKAMSNTPEPIPPSGFTDTKNPIMLVQGILAFDSIAGVDYWYGIASELESEGATVYTAHISAINNSEARGEQLITELENIRATDTSIDKFNLVAHSQGGLTSRYVMTVRPDLVASVTTMGAPHQGAPIADILEGQIDGGIINSFASLMGSLIDGLSGDDTTGSDTGSLIYEFSTAGIAEFNEKYPIGLPPSECGQGPASVSINGNDINLYSWGGGESFTSMLDPLDYMFSALGSFQSGPSDGITGTCSSHFGKVIRDDYSLNHADLINQTLGVVGYSSPDPVSLYRTHANRLKNAGL